jgi:hypothetical protein
MSDHVPAAGHVQARVLLKVEDLGDKLRLALAGSTWASARCDPLLPSPAPWQQIDYLKAENRTLKETLGDGLMGRDRFLASDAVADPRRTVAPACRTPETTR